MSMLIVRYVGSKEEDAIVQTHNKLYSTLTAYRHEFRSRLSRAVQSMMSPSWRSRCVAKIMTRTM
jgi:hypothetical protein